MCEKLVHQIGFFFSTSSVSVIDGNYWPIDSVQLKLWFELTSTIIDMIILMFNE